MFPSNLAGEGVMRDSPLKRGWWGIYPLKYCVSIINPMVFSEHGLLKNCLPEGFLYRDVFYNIRYKVNIKELNHE